MDRITVPLREIAREAGISADQAKYWVKLLGISPNIHGRIGYLDADESEKVKAMARLVVTGDNPKEAAAKVKGSVTDTAIIPQTKNDPLEEIRKVLMLLVEENRALRVEVSAMQKCLEFKKTEVLASIPVSDSPINPKKETPSPRSAPKVSPLVVKLPPVQRQLSTWESITLFFDDALGFIGLGG